MLQSVQATPAERYDQLIRDALGAQAMRVAVVHPCSAEALQGALEARDEGLFELLVYMAQRIADSAPITDYWRAIDRDHPLVREAQARLGRMVRPLIERAVHAGRCRADFAESDFVLAVGMVGALLRGHTLQQRRRLGRRALELLLDGLRLREAP